MKTLILPILILQYIQALRPSSYLIINGNHRSWAGFLFW